MRIRAGFLIVVGFSLPLVLFGCSPPLKAFQAAHPEKPCLQCGEIYVDKKCSNDLHNQTYKCSQPAIAYSLSPSGTCAQAQISCMRSASFPPVEQTVMIVGKVKVDVSNNSKGGIFGLPTTPKPKKRSRKTKKQQSNATVHKDQKKAAEAKKPAPKKEEEIPASKNETMAAEENS
ncbi:hypothetical protein M3Y99_00575600 [Aphelenchoides fujianensis]|nr:hypothetical protein M3Y99_00575600 [Aphelenchoides fujianensis]